jgi:hypothetical protein
MTGSEAAPVLAIVAGRPTARETAAVVVVLSARIPPARAAQAQAGHPAGTDAGTSQWAARSRLLRAPVTPAPGAWRASGLPR